MLLRSLRAVQDKVAAGSISAHEDQRRLLRDYGEEMRSLPIGVWDDVRNVRAAIFFVLSGGDPAVLKTVIGRERTPFVERRLLKGALAYGEGRLVDALSMIHKIEARKLDPLLGGMVALIQGTLVSKKDSVKAVVYFDEARLLSPGTLIEESALRQQILLLAREGELERFDTLTAQYSRRFPNSLFARNFRRQLFAGVARQNFKRADEWLTRTETELMKVPASDRIGLYLSIAEEATKAGNVGIARFAAVKARELAEDGSSAMRRAKLFEGAALVTTEDFAAGLKLLGEIDTARLRTSDREVYDAAMAIARSVGKWPELTQALDETPPDSVGRAQTLLSKVDSLLGGMPQ
jgi:chemotaxis protein MotC